MASEKVYLFSKIELEIVASLPGTFKILTDVPGDAMSQRFSFTVAQSNVGLRRTVRSRLPYNTQGHLVQCIYTPGGGQTALYSVRVWARELPGGQWQWYALPVIGTPADFSSAPVPVPGTPEDWQTASLPVPPTAEAWTAAALAIPPTPEDWRTLKLPIKPSPQVPDWIDLGVDA